MAGLRGNLSRPGRDTADHAIFPRLRSTYKYLATFVTVVQCEWLRTTMRYNCSCSFSAVSDLN